MKSRAIALRTTADERIILEKMAERERLNLSEFMRYLIRTEARRLDLWPPKIEVATESSNGATS